MRRALLVVADVGTYVAMAVAAAGAALIVLSAVDVVRPARVVSGSMRPTYDVGSLVVGVPVSAESVQVGDVVMFRPPAPFANAGSAPIAHRVAAVDGQSGRTVVRTRGDANDTADPWLLDAERTTFYRVAWGSSVVGRLVGTIDPTNPRAAANLVLIPAWCAALRLIWRDTSR